MGNLPTNNTSPTSSHVNQSPRNSASAQQQQQQNKLINTTDGPEIYPKKKSIRLDTLTDSEESFLTENDIRLVRTSWKELQSNDLRQYGTNMMIKLVSYIIIKKKVFQ